MNHAERFRALMDFQPVDRLPVVEWAPWWDKTLDRWRGEGLGPGDGADACRFFGLDVWRQHKFNPRGTDCPAPPHHGAGLIADADGYEKLRPHLYPPVTDATLAMLAERQREQDAGESLTWVTFEGFFWFPRTLLGIERHLYAFYDQPDLLHRMNADQAEYCLHVLSRVRDVCRPAFMTFAEDMSYNHGPMLSREQFETFCLPYYRRVVPALREMDIYVVVDSDGDVTEMIPWLTDAGVRGVLPLERQAGVDAGRLREIAPRLGMIGHFDKMTMTRGRDAMAAEFERLRPVAEAGGFVPSVDHQTPPGVSMAQYRTYVEMLKDFARSAAR